MDATADRSDRTLVVHAIHEDAGFNSDVADAVRAELEDLARWLGLALALAR